MHTQTGCPICNGIHPHYYIKMRTLTLVQDQVRTLIGDSKYSITDNANVKTMGLRTANQIYRKLANLYKWPEFIKTDETITTSNGSADYTWPTSPKFMDVFSLEVRDINSSNNYQILTPVKDELDWSFFSKEVAGFPSVYRFENKGGSKRIVLAPTPNISASLRIRGLAEPDDLTAGTSTTVFDSQITDDVFEFMIAAEISFKDNFNENGTLLIQRASSLITKLTGKDIQPKELDPRAKE